MASTSPDRVPRETVVARAWARWRVVARTLGTVQARVLLSAFYFLVVPPFALVMRARRDPLRLGAHRGPTGWIERPAGGASAEAARRQF
jgi:hypothetical protein